MTDSKNPIGKEFEDISGGFGDAPISPSLHRKIKIAFMTDKMDVRPEKSTFPKKLIENLLKNQEFEIYTIHYENMPDEPLYEKTNEIILPKTHLPWGSHFVSFMRFCLFTKENFDIFMWFVPRVYPFFWLVPAKKLVMQAHGGGDVLANSIFTIPKVIFNFILKHFNKYFAAIIGASDFGSKEIIYAYHVHPEKVFTMYSAIDPLYRPLEKNEISRVMAKCKITAEKYFFYFGTLQRHKNVKRLIEAYLLLRQEYPEIEEKLVLAGIHSKGQIEEIRNETKLDGSKYYQDVIFNKNPELRDRPAFYSGATAVILPSLNEGFGMSIIEGMACGTPVITSNISAMPEAAGGAALLVNPYDTRDIIEAMHKLATDKEKREELIKKGLLRARNFSWDQSIKNYVSLFKKIL
ncbi:MAG: glycosyltransferase family 1 protein [bacterium]|nr:glycosyltransferase family 1 protein [bacterium]